MCGQRLKLVCFDGLRMKSCLEGRRKALLRKTTQLFEPLLGSYVYVMFGLLVFCSSKKKRKEREEQKLVAVRKRKKYRETICQNPKARI